MDKKKTKATESVLFILTKKNSGKTMPDKLYPPSKSISAEDFVMVDGEERRIAYVKGESSCFPEDWRQTNPKYGRAPEFIKGKLLVSARDKCKIQFLELNNRNESNTDKLYGERTLYRRSNIEQEVKDALAEEIRRKEALDRVFDIIKDESLARAVARKMGVYANGKGDIYKMNLVKFSEHNSDEFLDFVNDAQDMESAVRLDMIHQANDEGHIVYNQGRWFWKNGGDSIIAVPKGADRHEYLTGWTFSGAEGKIWWSRLREIIVGEDGLVKEQKIVLSNKELTELNELSNDVVFKGAKDHKIVKYNMDIKQYQYDNGTEVIDLGSSKTKVIEFLANKNKAEIVGEIKAKVYATMKAN